MRKAFVLVVLLAAFLALAGCSDQSSDAPKGGAAEREATVSSDAAAPVSAEEAGEAATADQAPAADPAQAQAGQAEPASAPAEEQDNATAQAPPAAAEAEAAAPGSSSTQPPVPEHEYGGRIILGTIGEPSNMISALSSDSASHELASYLYVAPLKYDKNLNIVPWAAESLKVLDDGKLLKFVLRKGIRWDDGVEVTARDVEFTYKMMIDPNTPTAYAEDFKAIAEFKVTGPYSFEVRYDKPFARSLITWMSDILPRHKLEGANLLETPLAREPLSCGPYRLVEWDAGNRLVLEARDDYFEGRPYIDQVVYRIIPDMATMFLELKAGNLDMMSLTPEQYLFQTKGRFWDENFQKFKYLSFGYTWLGFNLKKPMFQDVRVRRALCHAIDREEIIKGVLLGLGLPANGPYKPGTWVHNDAVKGYDFDPDKAKALLAEAGWTPGKDGILEKGGQPFAFTILTNQGNAQRAKIGTIVQQRLADVGIKVELRMVEWASFIKEFVDKGRFDALILSWNILQDPDIYDVWHSSKAVDGGLNFAGFKNDEVDRLLEEGRSTLDQAVRKKAYDRLQEVLMQEAPYVFLYVPYALPIVHARFHGIEPAPSGITHNFNRWWVPKDQQRFSLERETDSKQ